MGAPGRPREPRGPPVARGARSIGPESGPLASGREGVGRMSEPAAIAAEAWRLATRRDRTSPACASSSPRARRASRSTRSASSRTARAAGWATRSPRRRGTAAPAVTLACRSDGRDPRRRACGSLEFETADDLHALLVREFPECDGLVMAAAVADFIPAASARRLHRAEGEQAVRLSPGTRHARQPRAAAPRPDRRRRSRPRPRISSSAAARKMEAKGADLDRRQRRRPAGHRIRRRGQRGADPRAATAPPRACRAAASARSRTGSGTRGSPARAAARALVRLVRDDPTRG